jgi:hypothetical protein
MSMIHEARGGDWHRRLFRPDRGDVDGRSRPRRLQGRRWPYRRSAFGGNIRVGGGSVGKFHTNPGGKYAYRGWSGKYDNHHHYGHYRRYGYCPRSIHMAAGAPISTGALWRRAAAYWWDRYRRCSDVY